MNVHEDNPSNEYNSSYSIWSFHICIKAYKKPENPSDWLPCRNCGLVPRVWVFDNGRYTACGCGKNGYDHFQIMAESVMSHYIRCDGSLEHYDSDALRKNWNLWVETGMVIYNKYGPFKHDDFFRNTW